jgi:hypothetical protein
MRSRLLALLAALILCAVGGPLHAANLLVNGDFEMVDMNRSTAVHSTIIGDGTGGSPLPVVTGWTTQGYNFVFVDNPNYLSGPPPGGLQQTPTGADDYFDPAYVDAGGSYGFRLWGPDNYANPTMNGLTNSPTGGNFLGLDGAYLNAPISQTVQGLTNGREYSVSFYWALGQQSLDSGGFDGATQDNITVCFGTCTYSTAYNVNGDGYATFDTAGNQIVSTSTRTNPDHGFTPWLSEYYTFTADCGVDGNGDPIATCNETLSLLSHGTPLGQPPFALIDGVNLSVVPEPTTWAMMLIGFGVIGAVMRTRRRSLGGHRALGAQII